MSQDHELKLLGALARLSKPDYAARTRRVRTTKVRPRKMRRFWRWLGAYALLERRVYPPDVVHAELIEALRREARHLPRERLPALARLLYFDGRTYFFTDESDRADDDPPVLAFNDQLDAPVRVSSSFVEYAASALLALVLPLSPDRVVRSAPAQARRPLPTCLPQLLLADKRLYLPLDVDPATADSADADNDNDDRWYEVPLPPAALRLLCRRPDELAQEVFGFLIEEQGFELQKAYDRQRESGVVYVSPRARVDVHIEHLPLGVSVSVGLYKDRATSNRVDEHALIDLVQDRTPDEAASMRAKVESLEQTLTLHAALLRRHAADLLGGQQSRVPRLRRRRAEAVRRRNKEAFGTSTGETPRFGDRPTLEALFAGGTDEGLRTPRAYQAHWDYGYTLGAIARFLGLDQAAVQAMLDEWDLI
jgi:hypothetical protein